ncbi:MAG TPA: glycosyltransferase family 4 protein [Actinomycetota bacterium]|nr:glycosyltransferase family 4 protein [Actinomycetota bacterium]
MRVLFLTPRQLGEPRSGGTIKSAAILSYLEARHVVEVVCFRGHAEQPWKREGGVVSIPMERDRSVRHLLSSYAAGVPLSIERNRSSAMAERVSTLLEPGDRDAVFVDGWLMAQYVPEEFAGIRLLHEHNAEHVMWRRHAELETNPVRRPLVRLEASRVRRYEARLLARFDVVFAVSERDRATLAALVPTGPEIALLPNVADPALLDRPELTPQPEPVLLFLATLSWPPNAEGLSRFLEGDLPALLERVPDARLVVAGSGAPGRLVRRVHEARGAEFAGPVEDDEALYRRARCFVDVGVGGSGTKIKVLNALARGLPVVTGPDGAAGLEVSSGEHLLIAEDRDAMVASLEFVIQEDAAWTNLSRSGRDLVRRRYVPEVAFGALDDALARR